jgi:CDP-glycerol glycerophosphotransferase (TagB/SpsB family)
LYYKYNDVTPGPKCYNWQDVAIEIENFLNDENYFKDIRVEIRDRFNYYKDSKSSERIYNFFKNLKKTH